LAAAVVEGLSAAKDAAQKALDAGVRDATAADVNRTAVYVGLADTKRIHAAQGVRRALAALREAVGLGPEVSLDVPPGSIPELETRPNRDDIVSLALARRGELAQARIFAQVGCLEGVAQAAARLQQRVPTFSAPTDIHSVQAPEGSNGTDYHPSGVAPEMPSLLVGTKSERVARAHSLTARAEAMVETTRNLIVLEAEDAFARSEETLQQAAQAKAAADAGEKLAEDMRKDFAAGAKVKVEDVVSARALGAQARADYNEFRFRHAIALADLERITSGGFTSGLVEAIDRPVEQIKLPKEKSDEAK
jgi:outer membrane protein TolC